MNSLVSKTIQKIRRTLRRDITQTDANNKVNLLLQTHKETILNFYDQNPISSKDVVAWTKTSAKKGVSSLACQPIKFDEHTKNLYIALKARMVYDEYVSRVENKNFEMKAFGFDSNTLSINPCEIQDDFTEEDKLFLNGNKELFGNLIANDQFITSLAQKHPDKS